MHGTNVWHGMENNAQSGERGRKAGAACRSGARGVARYAGSDVFVWCEERGVPGCHAVVEHNVTGKKGSSRCAERLGHDDVHCLWTAG